MDPIKRKRLNSFLCNVAKTSRIISQTVSGVDLPAIPLPSRNTKPPTLPPPPNILSELEATGAPTSVIMQELEKFEQGCRTLRRQTEAILCRLAQSTLDLPSLGGSKPDTPLRSSNFLESIYLKQVLNLKACTLKRVHAASANKSLRVRFNQVINRDVSKIVGFLTLIYLRNPLPSLKSISKIMLILLKRTVRC